MNRMNELEEQSIYILREAYRHFDSLDLSGLAWECLRRNSDYRATYPQIRDGLRSPAVWGLRFPG